MRIALVSDWYAPRIGGIERHLSDLARHLSASGHNVQIITTTPGPTEDHVAVHRLSVAHFPGTDVMLPTPAALSQLKAVLDRERIEVVHAHGTFSTLARTAILAAHHLGIPSVMTSHSLIRGFRQPSARMMHAISTRYANVLSAVSHAAAVDFSRVCGQRHVDVTPNATELPDVGPTPATDAGLRVITVMRLAPSKQPHDLLRAIPRVLEQMRDGPPVTFTIAGDGPARARLQQMAVRAGVDHAVRFVGAVTYTRVRELLADSHVYASPCRYEAFGLAALEARASGVPIVAMHHGGCSDVVEDGKNGLLASSIGDLANGLVRLLQDAPLREAMSRAGREGLEKFGWSRSVRRHVALYELARMHWAERHTAARSPRTVKETAQ